MNAKIQQLLDSIQQLSHLSDAEKEALTRYTLEADKELEMVSFKLDRTEKVKKTTAILLEETIEELEQKRKAVEVQNKELEIEASLERVRTVALSMNRRDDMVSVCRMISGQLELLNVTDIRNVQTAIFYEEKGTYSNFEYYAFHDKSLVTEVEYQNHPMSAAFAGEMLSGPGKFFTHSLEGKELKDWYTFQQTTNQFVDTHLEVATSLNYYWFSLGPVALGISTYAPLKESEIALFGRFRNVFELAYRRFLDIEKAAAQAREAQIETSLERVRAQAMAMHKPDDLTSICRVLYTELNTLGFPELRNAMINIHNDEKQSFLNYDFSDFAGAVIANVNYDIYPSIQTLVKQSRNSNEAFIEYVYSGKELKDWKEFRKRNGEYDDPRVENITSLYYYFYSIGIGSIGISTFSAIGGEKLELLKRFRNVFDLAYRRYVDITNAEAQAREAQIEAALERVRSRSMAMHKSDELKEVIRLVLEQFIQLKINAEHAGFYIDYKANDDMHIWLADPNIEPFFAVIPYFDTPTWNSFLEAKANGTAFHSDLLDFEEKNKFYQSLFRLFPVPEEAQTFYMQCKGLAVSTVLLDTVGLYIENFSAIPYTDEENRILMRFGKAFQQTYTRFLDLQKAEAQAREAQIEAALERVRSQAMAMTESNDLLDIVVTMRNEFVKLGHEAGYFWHMRWLKDTYEKAMTSGDGTKIGMVMKLPRRIHAEVPLLANWEKTDAPTVVYVMNVEETLDYVHKMVSWGDFQRVDPNMPTAEDIHHIGGLTFIMARTMHGEIGYSLPGMVPAPPPDAINTLTRFAAVFDLAYRRFEDLKLKEQQTREARVELALERVRARTLAMQKSDELAETSSELFRQMIGLGIEPNRLYITIIHEEKNEADFWITDEDGSKLTAAYTANFNDNATLSKMYEGWKQQLKHRVLDMQGDELQDYFHYLQSINVPFKGGLEQKRRVQHLAYFGNGFIGLASPDEQPAATLEVLERFAAVFNLTYTRFNDLKIAEAHALQAEQDLAEIKSARQKAEVALSELKATQKQLIQSEKMASLGELTAGIAHEIQNPLNFVNNFSEVSKELLDEMREELEKGNVEDAKEIMNDVIQNLEKINHHGKRADGIVKGMLQHSRAGSGQKELTDINALCDEYLRLAYHGLRAKDKTFNAKFETAFDETIGKINVLPQDLGRVILNLINNAFYAVTERKKKNEPGYEPTVTVSSEKEKNHVLIKVKDNGTGIPKKVLDKIFQPFFTTKPTGQGTGLGLSLSYDIIKAHGGELNVETKEGAGTSFIIQIPTNQAEE